MIFLNCEGNIIFRTSVFREPDEYIAFGKRV